MSSFRPMLSSKSKDQSQKKKLPNKCTSATPSEAVLESRRKRFNKKPEEKDYGLLSRGEDTRLTQRSDQILYFDDIQRKYIQCCSLISNSDELRKAFDVISNLNYKLPIPHNTLPSVIQSQKDTRMNELNQNDKTRSFEDIELSLRKLREATLACRADKFIKSIFLFSMRVTVLFGSFQSYVPCIKHLIYNVHPTVPLSSSELAEVCGIYALHLAHFNNEILDAYSILETYIPYETRVWEIIRAWHTKDYVTWRRLYEMEREPGRLKMIEIGEKKIAIEALKRIGVSYFTIQVKDLENIVGYKWDTIVKTFKCGWRLDSNGKVTLRERKAKISLTS
ncbi:hypothetical protein NADFUDRAFT_48718 [Nadsonia fulvescens var. elongata DSM 6958]|uniref:CSN8/PSMD8/EIF3K domain-containing protein n=1 Tax=Nadsonia fulvescens var. elongata DSM 6958 TaxID=857566 RepID=A0A1E3PRV8_9ASCO|nr:hypothetical protein NADFUDRAFT_48718 [Nadsonia fulvescens var. elongata DSM 6958]